MKNGVCLMTMRSVFATNDIESGYIEGTDRIFLKSSEMTCVIGISFQEKKPEYHFIPPSGFEK